MTTRLPSRSQLQIMGSMKAHSILLVLSTELREELSRTALDGACVVVPAARSRMRAKLEKVYALASDIGVDIGQPAHVSDALSDLSYLIDETCDWRRERAEKYSHDIRNLRAAEELLKLDHTLSYDLARQYQARYADPVPSEAARERRSEALRSVGFHIHPATMNDLVRAILGKRQAPALAA